MKRAIKFVLIGFLLLIAVVFIFRKPLIAKTLPGVEDVRLGDVKFINDSAYVTLTMTVRNKGVWHIDLRYMKIRIFDDTALLLTYENDTLKTLERNEVKTEYFYCKIPVRKVASRIRMHQGEDTVGLLLKGEIVYSTMFGEMTMHVDRKIPVTVPIPPQLFIREVEYQGRTDNGYALLFHLTLKNENPRALELKDVKYDLEVGKDVKLNGQLDNITIAAEDSTQLLVPAQLHVENRLLLISRIVLDRDVMEYRFAMSGIIESFTGVVKDDIPIIVNSYGQMELYNEDRINRPKVTFRKKQR